MPNPTFPNERGPCQTCGGYGGPYPGQKAVGATVCNWWSRSGKRVSRIPDIGCSGWERAPVNTVPLGPNFGAQFAGSADPGPEDSW
jgi:hypothetical protein